MAISNMTKNPNKMAMLEKVAPVEAARATLGLCPFCEGQITGFRDVLSEREFHISGLCQKCQDETFGGPEE